MTEENKIKVSESLFYELKGNFEIKIDLQEGLGTIINFKDCEAFLVVKKEVGDE